MILILFVALPVVSGFLCLLARLASGRLRELWPRLVAFAGSLSVLVLAGGLWIAALLSGKESGAWLVRLDLPWIRALGASFALSLDGLSLPFLALSGILGLAAVIASWKGIRQNTSAFHFFLCLALAGVNGVFLASDLFLFVFMWELMLIPMFFLIDLWGHEGRHRAAVKFLIFTQAGGLLMIAALAGLYVVHGSATGDWTFAYDRLLGTVLPAGLEILLMLGFFAGFAVKLPAFGLHPWLPDAHTEAPTAGSILLAGLLLKTGGYGMLRFAIPLFPDASRAFAPIAMWLGVAGILYGGLMALGQSDMKRLIAYSSVSHLGFVLLGIYSMNPIGRDGAVIQMLAHGLSTGGLFLVAGALQDRLGTRELSRMGGLQSLFPRMGALGLVLTLALVGLPGTANFAGEFLVLYGAFTASVAPAVVASIGLVLTLAYGLRMFQKAFHGQTLETRSLPDLGFAETATLGFLVVASVFIGIYPEGIRGILSLATSALGGGVAP